MPPDGTLAFRASLAGRIVLVALTGILLVCCFGALALVFVGHASLVAFLLVMLALASVGVLFAASATFDALVSKVELWPDGRIRVRLPTFRGPIAWLPVLRRDIRPSDVAAVEIRREVQRSAGLTSVVDAAALRLAGGETIVLGRTADRALVGMPIAAMTAAIAEATGKPLVDHGTVDRGGVLGGFWHDRSLSWDEPSLDEASVRKLLGAVSRTWAIVGVLVGLTLLVRACAG